MAIRRIGLAAGHLMFRLADGSTISCDCIAEPYASRIAAMQDDIDKPRRCDTNACDLNGDCIACHAVSGEVCRAPRD